MSKQPHQKQKLLYLLKMLWEQSDEDHPLSVQKLIDNLAQEGIIAERKSIYDDMKQLQDFGFDIIHVKSRVGGGYYLGSRIFKASGRCGFLQSIHFFKEIKRTDSQTGDHVESQ